MAARWSIIYHLIETFIVVWKCVEVSEIGNHGLIDVQDVLKRPHPRLLR